MKRTSALNYPEPKLPLWLDKHRHRCYKGLLNIACRAGRIHSLPITFVCETKTVWTKQHLLRRTILLTSSLREDTPSWLTKMGRSVGQITSQVLPRILTVFSSARHWKQCSFIREWLISWLTTHWLYQNNSQQLRSFPVCIITNQTPNVIRKSWTIKVTTDHHPLFIVVIFWLHVTQF